MSLFDFIKYPITTPLTIQVLKTLPDDIVIKWAGYNGDRNDDGSIPDWVYESIIYNHIFESQINEVRELDSLRKIILEHDE